MIQTTMQFTDEENRRVASQRDRILAMLKQGPVMSTELIPITHRFSSPINQLKDRGYQIMVEKLDDGTSIHTLTGYTPLVEVTEEMKLAYYDTLHWAETRLERMRLDEFRCCHCRKSDTLQVHHWVYDLFAESLEDLVTLCDGCHERIHLYDCVKLHFPKYVSQSIADRIGGAK